MEKILLTWLGFVDLNAALGIPEAGMGPVGQAVLAGSYDKVVMLSSHDTPQNDMHIKWLSAKSPAKIVAEKVAITTPYAFGEIYEHAVRVIQETIRESPNARMTFHLSPGTPAMAAVWIILGKTRFPAELIESSQKYGVRVASVPFDISADFLPDLLRKPDEELARLTQGLPPDAPEFDAIIHRCDAMKRLVARARRAAPRNVSVLIEGESGTGKELLARAIHNASPLRKGPFVAVNCGAIPTELVDAEFFGHEKGAFTGAIAQKAGFLEAAHGGTLFLDEIGELPVNAQVKLLRALQEREILRVGSTTPKKVDIRVIAATNRNLFEEVGRGRFREDLFHRLAVAVLHVPPVRERKGDLSLLIEKLLEHVNAESASQPGYEPKKLTAAARTLLLAHTWPGNVRELLNTLQRAAIWSGGCSIDDRDIQESLLPAQHRAQSGILDRPLGDGLDLQELLDDVARHYMKRAIEESGGNKTAAAQLLGLPSYQTFSNWVKRYNVERAPSGRSSRRMRVQ